MELRLVWPNFNNCFTYTLRATERRQVVPIYIPKRLDFLFKRRTDAVDFIRDINNYNAVVPASEEKFLKIIANAPLLTVKGHWKVSTVNFKNKDCHPEFKVPSDGIVRLFGYS